MLSFVRCFQNLTERLGSAAGRVLLHFVMRFDNLTTKIRSEQFGSFSRQPEKHINSHAEIRCENHRHRVCCFFNNGPLFLRMTSRSDDERLTVVQRGAADFIDCVGVTEIDCQIAIFHRWLD